MANNFLILFRIFLRKIGIIYLLKTFKIKNKKFWYKQYEDKQKIAISNNLKEGMIAFDIGANEGLYTKLFAEIVKNKGSVFAFEPSQEATKKIREM